MTNRSMEPTPPLEPNYGRRMSHMQAVLLCRYAKAACPQQAFDEYTPDAWADLLEDVRFEDAQLALKALVKRQPFVAPAEIRAEVTRIRNKRIGDFGIIPEPPPEIAATPETYHHWFRNTMRAIGDGAVTRDTFEPAAIESGGTPEQKAALRELVADAKRGLTDVKGDEPKPRRDTTPKPRLPRTKETR